MRPLRLAASLAIAALAIAPVARAQAPGGPDPELLQRGLCGSPLAAEQSLLFGTVRSRDGAPAGGLRVAAMWTEAVLTRDGAQTLLRASIDTTAADGTYALCGVPRETRVTVRADGDAERSGELSIAIPNDAIVERDLVVAGANPAATVTGYLRGERGAAVVGTIDLLGDSAVVATTDSAGSFRLSAVPRRSSQLRIRAIGYVPHYVDVTPDGPLVELGPVEMPARVQELDEVLIKETTATRERREFEERRRTLIGVFVDSAFLSQFAWRSANSLRMASGMIRGKSDKDGDMVLLRQRIGECAPLVYLDGLRIGRMGRTPSFEMTGLLQRAKRMEFYLAGYAPAEFADFGGCGAMLIWTR